MAKVKVAVFISGRGSNLQALIDACAAPDYPAEIVLVISNRPDAYGLERARKADIHTQTVDHKGFDDRESFEHALDAAVTAAGVELVCLAGFMRILTPWFVNRWRDRLINIHPSLLPAFKGVHIHERVIDAGVRVTGCTVHFVRADTDSGPIIVQAAVPVAADDTPEALEARVLEAEHECFPLAVRLVAEGRVRVSGEVAQIKGLEPVEGLLINPAP
jgi:phosphoribosylglycinamide formyltransferase-1